jgi:hypothetical protein
MEVVRALRVLGLLRIAMATWTWISLAICRYVCEIEEVSM